LLVSRYISSLTCLTRRLIRIPLHEIVAFREIAAFGEKGHWEITVDSELDWKLALLLGQLVSTAFGGFFEEEVQAVGVFVRVGVSADDSFWVFV
jgi:hypothetical protein